MNSTVVVDLEINQGATFKFPLLWQDTQKPPQPIDITGRNARMHIRQDIADTSTLLELTDANGRIILGGAAGTIEIKLTAAETSAITWDYGVYDLELYYDDAGEEVVDKLIRGNISVIKEVTR